MSGDKNCIAENIRAIITKTGVKQKTITERSGFSENDFSNLLNGRKLIRSEYIVPIANALGVTPNDLFAVGDNEKSRQGSGQMV